MLQAEHLSKTVFNSELLFLVNIIEYISYYINYNTQSAAIVRFCSENQIRAIDYEKAEIIWPFNYMRKSRTKNPQKSN